jgi:hypothetical protein
VALAIQEILTQNGVLPADLVVQSMGASVARVPASSNNLLVAAIAISVESIFASAVTIWASATVPEEQIGDADHQQEQRRDTGPDDAVNVVNILKPTRRVPMTSFSANGEPNTAGWESDGRLTHHSRVAQTAEPASGSGIAPQVGSRLAPPIG